MIYRVTATMHGKRIATSKTFATKAEAHSLGIRLACYHVEMVTGTIFT
jgi:hypothetical protein